ncbi:OOPDA-like protein [Mya arenaria]|uniref:OOPDA-like protein n=1 Tax=Mya arenaria TaxID=6604 RepID=A0ABY7DRT9_MYAAR|nr:OOPDA-like protein [Mya arenaria]
MARSPPTHGEMMKQRLGPFTPAIIKQSQNEVLNIIQTAVRSAILHEYLVELTRGCQKQDGCDSLKALEPLLTLRPLTPDIDKQEGYPVDVNLVLCDALCCLSRMKDVQLQRHIILKSESDVRRKYTTHFTSQSLDYELTRVSYGWPYDAPNIIPFTNFATINAGIYLVTGQGVSSSSIPEIPKDTKVTNPIMDYDKFPQFSKMNKDSVVRGCAKLALLFDVEYDKLVQTLGSKKLSFEEIIDQMERSMAPMQYGMHQAEILTQNSYKDFPRSFFNRTESQVQRSAPDVGPWRVTLKKPVVEAFLEVCPNRKLRFKVWNGWHIIGTHFSTDIRLHTFEIPGQITEARYREHFYPMAKKEMEDLQQFANSSGFPEAIRQWDITFFRRQHCDKLYNMHKVDRKPYFSVPLVLETMFSVCERMFSIKIEPVLQPDVWNSDVMAFDVHNLDGAFVGRFYLDLYARPTKRMADTTYLCRERCDRLGMTPISVITLNLNKSEMSGIPSLMSFQDVLTLFGEVLSEVPLLELSSQRNIDRDAIFVCANVMKMIAQQPSIVRDMSQHHLSGESLDDHDIDKLLKCQLHMKGFDMCHQLYKSAFDIENHLAHDNYWKDIQMDMYKLFMPLEIHKEDWIWCSDPTLWMSDAFAAAYYLHIWSEMLAANIMEEFTVSGFDNEKQLAKVGMRFRETYLAVGGAESAKSVFQKFTGRNPSLESLLKRYPR